VSVPEGAQLSEDGNFWWDGTDWQPVPSETDASTETESEPEVTDQEIAEVQQEIESDAGLQELSDTDLSSLSDDEE
jgi:hypothetical protein